LPLGVIGNSYIAEGSKPSQSQNSLSLFFSYAYSYNKCTKERFEKIVCRPTGEQVLTFDLGFQEGCQPFEPQKFFREF